MDRAIRTDMDWWGSWLENYKSWNDTNGKGLLTAIG